jgi:CheY-like chemotaxis protein
MPKLKSEGSAAGEVEIGKPRAFSQFPVVVLSNSVLEEDARKAKSLGAREYLIKPASTVEYRNLALGLHQRWLAMRNSWTITGRVTPGCPGNKRGLAPTRPFWPR